MNAPPSAKVAVPDGLVAGDEFEISLQADVASPRPGDESVAAEHEPEPEQKPEEEAEPEPEAEAEPEAEPEVDAEVTGPARTISPRFYS